MADLSKNAPLRIWNDTAFTESWILDNSTAQTIYKGQPIVLDTNVDASYVRGFVNATTLTSTDIFIGIAAEGPKVVATGDLEIDNEIIVYVDRSIIGFLSTVYDDSDVGDPVYMSDSATLHTLVDDNPAIGKLHRVVDGYAYVQIVSPYICSGA